VVPVLLAALVLPLALRRWAPAAVAIVVSVVSAAVWVTGAIDGRLADFGAILGWLPLGREIDGSDGTTVISSSDGCEICGVSDVGGLIETQAATLRTKLDALASGPAAIVVTSDPEGADVTLDGEPFGITPLDKRIIPGDHTIRVTKDGYISVQEQRTFVEGARETLAYELDKVPNRLPKRPWGWASLGVGIAAIGGGVALTFMHDRPFRLGSNCTGDDVDAQQDCRYLYNTKWEGLAAGLVGGALLTLGIAVLVTTSKGKTKKVKGEAAMRRMKVSPSGVGIAF